MPQVRQAPRGAEFRNFIENINGYENLFSSDVREWIEEFRDCFAAYIRCFYDDSENQKLLEKIGCRPPKSDWIDWIKNQNMADIEILFKKELDIKA